MPESYFKSLALRAAIRLDEKRREVAQFRMPSGQAPRFDTSSSKPWRSICF